MQPLHAAADQRAGRLHRNATRLARHDEHRAVRDGGDGFVDSVGYDRHHVPLVALILRSAKRVSKERAGTQSLLPSFETPRSARLLRMRIEFMRRFRMTTE